MNARNVLVYCILPFGIVFYNLATEFKISSFWIAAVITSVSEFKNVSFDFRIGLQICSTGFMKPCLLQFPFLPPANTLLTEIVFQGYQCNQLLCVNQKA